MKDFTRVKWFAGLCVALLGFTMLSCGGGDDGEEATGTGLVQGNVALFDSPATLAASVQGVVVRISGPVTRETTTDAAGNFVFTGLPAGDYTLTFLYNGEEVTYRGQSGQAAAISVADGHGVLLTDVRISGGAVNIGNLQIVPLDEFGNPIVEDDQPGNGTAPVPGYTPYLGGWHGFTILTRGGVDYVAWADIKFTERVLSGINVVEALSSVNIADESSNARVWQGLSLGNSVEVAADNVFRLHYSESPTAFVVFSSPSNGVLQSPDWGGGFEIPIDRVQGPFPSGVDGINFVSGLWAGDSPASTGGTNYTISVNMNLTPDQHSTHIVIAEQGGGPTVWSRSVTQAVWRVSLNQFDSYLSVTVGVDPFHVVFDDVGHAILTSPAWQGGFTVELALQP